MARTSPPPLTKRPKELFEFEHDVKWTRKGQKLAKEMAEYIFEALAIPAKNRPQIPRVLAYTRFQHRDGSESLPMLSNYLAIYYCSENFIALQIPDTSLKEAQASEYDFIAKSPIIGEFWGTPYKTFVSDIAHEVSHWGIDKVLNEPKSAVHGKKWRLVYALLREKFVNSL